MAKTTFGPGEIRGIIPPLVTPFAEDETIDEAALRLQLRYMMKKGVVLQRLPRVAKGFGGR
jgi:hypothetical protein